MLRSMICGSRLGLMYVCNGGWPLSSIARFITFPPSIRQYGGVSVHPPAMSILTGLRAHTIWSEYTDMHGCCFTAACVAMSP